MAFSFGTTQSKPLFGSSTPASSTGFFGVSSNPTSSAGFSFGSGGSLSSGFAGFGQNNSTSQSSFGGFSTFGATNTTSGFNFNSGNPSFSFNNPVSLSLPTSLTSATTGFSGFNLSNAQQQSSLFSQQQPQQQQQQLLHLKTSLTSPQIFGDERDQTILKWNTLQASSGSGKGFFTPSGQFISYSLDNPYCLFKAVGYSQMPSHKNESGFVNLIFKKPESQIQQNQPQVIELLHKLLGSKTNYLVCVDSLRPIDDNSCEVTIYVQDRQLSGITSRLLSTDLQSFLCQPNIRQQLTSLLSVENVYIKILMQTDQLKYYLDNPPAGIDPRIWNQAKLDNPDLEKLIPVPILGFPELLSRLKQQEQQTHLHKMRMNVINSDLTELKNKQGEMKVKVDEMKRKQALLGHKVLQILVKQEVLRKAGYPIQPDEEQLSAQLQSISLQISAPTQIKGRLNELMSQIRMNSQSEISRPDIGFVLDDIAKEDIKQHLTLQQEGIGELMKILKADLQDLKIIENDFLNYFKNKK